MGRKSAIQDNETTKSENDLWTHAGSIEPSREKLDQMIEVAFMKELFMNHLPIGQNKEPIEKYFMDLEQVISTKDYIQLPKDEFPRDDDDGAEDADSSADGNPSKRRQYQYYSASLLKQQAQRQRDDDSDQHSDLRIEFSGYDNECGEEIQSPPNQSSSFRIGEIQDQSEGSGHLACVAECEELTDSDDLLGDDDDCPW